MEAASRGAGRRAARSWGSCREPTARGANEYADVTVVTGLGHARNLSVVASADVVVAVGGEWGTLSEIGLAGVLGRPLVLLAGWRLEHDPACPSGSAMRATPRRRSLWRAGKWTAAST